MLGGSVESFSRGKKIRFAQAEPTEEGKKLAADNSGGGELYALYTEDKGGRFVFSDIIDKTEHSGYFKSRAVAVPLESTIGEPELFKKKTAVYNVIGSSKDKGNWVKVWENAMLSGGYAPNTRQCYVAGSGKIGCTQPGPRSIVGGHVVKNSTETEPKEGADFVYILPICKRITITEMLQPCRPAWPYGRCRSRNISRTFLSSAGMKTCSKASAESAPDCLCGAVYAVKNRGSPQRRLRTAA